MNDMKASANRMAIEPLLRVEDLVVSFNTEAGTARAVDGVSFSVMPGEILGVVGESGCGKSLTAMSLLRLIPHPPGRIEQGRVWFRGRDLLAMSISDLRRVRGREIGMIFQEPMTALSPLHRVGQQLVEAQRFHGDINRDEAWTHAVRWMEKVGIPDAPERMYAYPHELSGGMRQRVMIASVLMMEPALIIADEPTTALDVTIQAQILRLLMEAKNRETAVLFITHNLGVIWETCSRLIVMYASEIVEQGPVEAVFARPRHPYTRALLKANPALAARGARLETIPGQVPSLLRRPAGCRFADRCPMVQEQCRQAPVALTPEGLRSVRCVRADEVSPGGEGSP